MNPRFESSRRASQEKSGYEALKNLTQFGRRGEVREYVAALNDESLKKLLPKNLRPSDPSATMTRRRLARPNVYR